MSIMSVPKNKYRKGFPIFGMDALIYEHLEKGKWVFLRDKPVHPSVILNMTVQTVRQFMNARAISVAVDQRAEYWAKRAEGFKAKEK